MSSEKMLYPTLTHYFEAPDEFRGEFGWLCGYSADTSFLEAAAERFTRYTNHQRAHLGQIALAVMLDPGNPQIKPGDVPGVLHLPYREPHSGRPFRLLHAKVALLAFCHQTESGRRLMRLIVSTGNWTRQTLEDSLDLAWCSEIETGQLRKLDEAGQQACADIWAAWHFLSALRQWFDDRVLQVQSYLGETDTTRVMQHFTDVVNQIGKKARGVPARFFDNRRQGLLAQLPGLVKRTGHTRRNCLIMGSGFYESAQQTHTKGVPQVIQAIVNRLRGENAGTQCLTQEPWVEVFVNP